MASDLSAQYERIFAEYRPALLRLASCYESVPPAREDLMQEILLAIWKALPRFRGDCSERTFVFRIAHNRCLSHVWLRVGWRHAPSGLNTSGEPLEVPDPRAGPEAQAIESGRRQVLRDAIRQLPLNYRQVILLALEDLSPPEIAAVLGVTENNVGVRLNRARKALRSILERHA